MSEIDTRIVNLERELEALKAAREAEKNQTFQIEGDVFVGQVFPTRDGKNVTVTQVLDPSLAWGSKPTKHRFRARTADGRTNLYYTDGKYDTGSPIPNDGDITGQAIGVNLEVGGVYRDRLGRIAIVTEDRGRLLKYRYKATYVDGYRDNVTACGKMYDEEDADERDLVRKIGTVNLDA